MRYTPPEIKKIKEGDLLFFHTRGFSPFSWAIRLVTGGQINHIGQIVSATDSIVSDATIVEALGKGIKESKLSDYVYNKKYWLSVGRVNKNAFKDEEEYREAIQTVIARAKQSIGLEYDWGVMPGLLWRCALRRLGLSKLTNFKSLLNERMKFYCSEAVCEFWKGTSTKTKHLFAGEKFHTELTPMDLAKSKSVFFISGKFYKFFHIRGGA